MLGDQGTLYTLFIYFFRYLIDFRRKKNRFSQIYLDWKNTLDRSPERSWKNSYSKFLTEFLFLLKANYYTSTTPTVGVDFLFKSFFLSFFVCFTQWTEPMKRGGRRWGKEILVIMMAQSNSVLVSLVIHWFRLLLYWWIRQDGEPTSSFAWSNGEVWIFTLNLSLSTFRINLVVSYRKSWNLMGHSTRCLYHDRW